jgi:nucleotide-binding universal stress UspA family protein
MMASVKHILIATDGSEQSLRAAALGGTLARALSASVSIITAIDEEIVVAEAWGGGSAEDARRNIEARKSREEIERTLGAIGDLPSEPNKAVTVGHIADEICKFAEENNVDLIVMGSHGRRGIKRALLGSVSHSVVNRATCAVTIVH